METNEFVTFEVAQRLKECGFDEPCIAYYFVGCDGAELKIGNVMCHTNAPEHPDFITAAFLWQAQKWLREAKGIYAYPEINALKKWFARAIDMKRNEDLLFDGTMFGTYEEAQSHAIRYALQLLDNEKE